MIKCCLCGGMEVIMKIIKVLGGGCKSCHILYENAQEAVKDLEIEAEVHYITDMKIVMSYGIMSMPALVIDEQIASMGKVLKTAEIKKLLAESML